MHYINRLFTYLHYAVIIIISERFKYELLYCDAFWFVHQCTCIWLYKNFNDFMFGMRSFCVGCCLISQTLTSVVSCFLHGFLWTCLPFSNIARNIFWEEQNRALNNEMANIHNKASQSAEATVIWGRVIPTFLKYINMKFCSKV